MSQIFEIVSPRERRLLRRLWRLGHGRRVRRRHCKRRDGRLTGRVTGAGALLYKIDRLDVARAVAALHPDPATLHLGGQAAAQARRSLPAAWASALAYLEHAHRLASVSVVEVLPLREPATLVRLLPIILIGSNCSNGLRRMRRRWWRRHQLGERVRDQVVGRSQVVGGARNNLLRLGRRHDAGARGRGELVSRTRGWDAIQERGAARGYDGQREGRDGIGRARGITGRAHEVHLLAKLARCCGIATDALVRVDSVHAHGAILALVVDTIVDVDFTQRARKAGRAGAAVVGVVRVTDWLANAPIVAGAVELRIVHPGRRRAWVLRDLLLAVEGACSRFRLDAGRWLLLRGRRRVAMLVLKQDENHPLRLLAIGKLTIDGVVLDVHYLVVPKIPARFQGAKNQLVGLVNGC